MMKQPLIAEVVAMQSTVAKGVNSCNDYLPDFLSEYKFESEWKISIDQGAKRFASVISIGIEADRTLQQYNHGYVLAVFARSFYVQCGPHVVCVGVKSLGRGPLQVLLASQCDTLPFDVVSGVSIDLQLYMPRDAGCDFPDRYTGKVAARVLHSSSFQFVKKALSLTMPPAQPGFGWISSSSDWQYQERATMVSNAGAGIIDASLVKHSLPALKCLHRWLQRGLQRGLQSESDTCGVNSCDSLYQVYSLLGAGPGLTPSGDDLLAGVLLALHRLQRADLADYLWQLLESHLQLRTNVISGAHLRMAAVGQCSEPVNLLLEYLFDRNSCHSAGDVQVIASNIQSMASTIGASSGWDMLAGMSMVLRTQ